MKKIYLGMMLIVFVCHLNAQNFTWSKIEGLYAYDYGYGIGTDNSGNVYLAGKYEENANFSGTILPCQGNHDIYLAQYSASGNLNWIRTGGGTNGDYARSLACNKTDRVYIAGEIEGSPTPVVFPGSSATLVTQGDNDVFLATYDLNGNLLWAKSEGAIKNEKALGITYDNGGNVIICGYFTDTTRFNGIVIPGNGDQDMFVAKYDMNGNFLWMKHAGGPGDEQAKSVLVDPSGNIYVCGMYSDGAVFGSSTFSTANTAWGKFYDIYIAKYSPNGTLLWVKRGVGDYNDIAWSMTMDNAGKLYVTGDFSGADFGGIMLWPYGMEDVFVACYDQNGNVQWVVRAGHPWVDRARGIGTDGSNIYITGQFGGTATFGPHTITAADSSDIFIASLNNAGSFIWATSIGGPADTYEPDSYESGIAICAEGGSAYVTGSILDGGVFGGTTIPGYTRSDAFITKLSTAVGVNEMFVDNNNVQIYPNPGTGVFSIHVTQKSGKDSKLNVYNYLGEVIYEANSASNEIKLDLSTQKKGIYFVQLSSGEENIIEKIVLQ
jgi:hypothetical protein